jgi:hypothetical protein
VRMFSALSFAALLALSMPGHALCAAKPTPKPAKQLGTQSLPRAVRPPGPAISNQSAKKRKAPSPPTIHVVNMRKATPKPKKTHRP